MQCIYLEPRTHYDAAIVRHAVPRDDWPRETRTKVAIYSREKVIEISRRINGWTRLEAEEWFEFNIACLWSGEGTWSFTRQESGE